MRAQKSAGLLLLVFTIALLTIPRPSPAYLETIWLSGTGVELIRGPGTIRLAGMGNLIVAIEDENNQVDLYDFSGNVASLVLDRDSSNADSWISYGKWMDEKNDFRWQDIGIWQGGALVALRGKGNYAGGATISTRMLDVTRVDDAEFRKALGIALPKSEIAVPDTVLLGTDVTSDYVEGYYTQRVYGRAFLGVHGWGTFDSESRPTRLLYELTNSVTDYGSGLGLVVLATKWLQLGGTVDLESQLLQAESSDSFHDDLYDRKRSILSYSSQALLDFAGKLRGVMHYKHSSFEDDQTLNLNWSDSFLLNPRFGTDMRMKVKVSSESNSTDFYATRWIVSNLRTPITVSGYFDYLSIESSLYNYPNVLVYLDEFDDAFKQWNLRGGASYKFGQKGLVGMEARLNRGRIQDKLPTEQGSQNFRVLDIRGGAEYRLLKRLALRAGYARAKEERYMGVPTDNFNSNTISVGAGWYMKNDRLVVDAAFYDKVTKPEQDLGDGRVIRDQSVMLYGRFLF